MKESMYNYVVKHTEEEGSYILFNGLTKALLILDENEKIMAEKILSDPNNTAGIDEMLRESLIRNEFIIRDTVNELNIIKYRYLNLVYNKNELSLTVLPTLQCNFNCVYCYQKISREVYKENNSEEEFTGLIKERIYKMIQNKLSQGVRHVRLTWYGGEPTLAMNDIIKMTNEIGEICHQAGADFWINICSNGYLLTEENMKPIKQYLGGVTVTIDGPAEVHDKRRRYYGESSFDTIVNNLRSLQELIPEIYISLRVTIDKANIDTIPTLLDELKEKGLKNLNIRYRSLYADPSIPKLYNLIFSDEEMAVIIPGLIREAVKRDIIADFSPTPSSFMRCNGPSRNAFVIMPDGYLHKCWGDVGTKDCIVGELTDSGEEMLNDKAIEWFTYSPLDKPECVDCKLLPVCMGECCYNDVIAKFKSDYLSRSNAGCSLFKYNFDEFLSLYAKLVEKRNNLENGRANDETV